MCEAVQQRAKDFFASHPAMNDVRTLKSVVDEGLDGFVGVFVSGGHAPIVIVYSGGSMREGPPWMCG